MAPKLSIAIIGAGIGGLCSAIALRRAGHDVRVFERAAELRDVGHGLTLWSNALKVLRELDLADAVRAAGCEMQSGEFRDLRGRVLVRTPVAEVAREIGAPCVAITRADLQRILLAALPSDVVELGARCVGARNERDHAVALFEHGREERAELVIGADGLHSAVRDLVHAREAPRYAGYNCWRALVAFEHPLCPPAHAFEAWGPGARFGRVAIDRARTY